MQEYEVFVSLSIPEYITVTADTEDEAIDKAKEIFKSINCEITRLYKHVNACVVGFEGQEDQEESE